MTKILIIQLLLHQEYIILYTLGYMYIISTDLMILQCRYKATSMKIFIISMQFTKIM